MSVDRTGADPTGALGCCTHGAHFVDKADRTRVLDLVDELTPDEWQYHGRARDRGGPLKKKGDEWVTRKADGACIFLNRAGFGGGAGCALHAAALRRGARPLDWKPTVCWQVPIRLDVHTDEYGHETVLVRAWLRPRLGPGGNDFHWWCIEEPIAYQGDEPVYRAAHDELTELLGARTYRRLVAIVDERLAATPVEITAAGRDEDRR